MNQPARNVAIRSILIAIWALTIGPGTSGATQPNIVVIVSDDAGYNDFGFMPTLTGMATEFETPNLDTLASNSVVMSSGYVSAPLCSPSRAGFLTGQYQQRFGYEDNPGDDDGLEAAQLLMSHQLKDLGYTTGAIGKWHLGETDEVNRPLDKGFDEFFGFFGGGRPYWGYPGADVGRAMRRGNANVESQWVNEGDMSRYDPANGRYLTDAFGEEAADFINRHAADENPFFLYVSLSAPHTPFDAKQEDRDYFSDIDDSGRRVLAAMTRALDRAVGDVTGALTANGIDNDTIVVFMNDNGGPAPSVGAYDNGPLRGNKGSLWEGGIRVPFMIKAPGLAAGIYDESVVSLDLMPTLVNIAGGDSQQIDTDGTDLMPFLSGELTGDPHELMFWRSADGRFAVRKGDWKLVRPGTATFARLHNTADDIHEDTFVNSQHPEIVEELLRELTFWEATLHKMKWGALGASRNRFDHFVFRNDVASQSNWSTSGQWTEAGTTNVVNLIDEDAYANAIIEFGTRDDEDYTATNNLRRATNQTFMLNQIRFTGSFAGTSDFAGTINGNALLLTKSLEGENPRIQLDAKSVGTSSTFTFQLDNELQLLDDLEITGDGTENFLINSDIRDYYEPRNVSKSDSSDVTLTGNNTFGGTLSIGGGKLTLSGPSAAIDGAVGIVIGADGRFTLDSGMVAVQWLDNSAGGTFSFNGGLLQVVDVAGSLTNNGGTFAPGASPAKSTIGGNLLLLDGILEIEIGGTSAGDQFDQLIVGGTAVVNDTLDIELINGFVPSVGDAFQFLLAGSGVSNVFDNALLPSMPSDVSWNLLYGTHSVALFVGPAVGIGNVVPGDYNQDGAVDAADYTVWRDTLGQLIAVGTGADGDFDGQVTAADFEVWASMYGFTSVGGASLAVVPEPGSLAIVFIGATYFYLVAPCRHRRRP